MGELTENTAEIRAFLALELPDEVRRELAELKKRLAKRLPDLRWSRLETLHLTVRFLGALSPERFDAVGALVDAGLETGGPLELFPSGLGAFPSPERARVLWVRVGGDTARLARLAMNLEAGLEALGVPREAKPFRAHLTLGRAGGRPRDVGRVIKEFGDFQGPSWSAGEVVLFQSILDPKGARHLPRHRGLLR